MASVIFRIKGTSDLAGIKVRFKQGDKFDFELSTGLKVPRRYWNAKQQRVKHTTESSLFASTINKKLNDLKPHILNSYYDATASNTPITQLWLRARVSEKLKNQIAKESDSTIYFVPYVKDYIKEATNIRDKKTGKKLSERTINSYETTIQKLKDYESKYGLKLRLSDINLSFHTKFNKYLADQLYLNPNTIGGYISKIKLFCNSAELKGLEISKDVKSRNFYSPQNLTNDIYLTTTEIERIFNHHFLSNRLDNARDWFIIGLWTGLRVSDLLTLNSNCIEGEFIHKTTLKTSTPVVIPIHPQVEKTLVKNNNQFPRKISEQKFNMYIKEVCKEVGLTELTKGAKQVPILKKGKTIYRKKQGEYPKFELVSTHICRRSFATNLYGEIETMVIMKITGHSTEKMLLNYIKKTPMEYAQKLNSLWNK